MPQLTRRRFLAASASAAAFIAAPRVRANSVSANEKINIACMGVRGRGDSVMRTFAAQPDVHLLYICDIDQGVLSSRASAMEKQTGRPVKGVVDYREVLDDKNVHALVVTTPDHWHAIPTIAACIAGKDVYVEKPDGHNIHEGRVMVAAARKYERMVQMGTQLRSAPFLHEARRFVAEGGIGKVLYGRAWETARQGAIPQVPDSDPPAGVDYDRWLGPAPQRPFNRMRFHGNWRWFFDYGCGDLGNDGVHRLDYCRMVMGVDELPRRVSCSGGKLFFDDAQEWPDTMIANYEFGNEVKDNGRLGDPKRIMTYEMRIWSRPRLHDKGEGAAVYGENGWILIDNGGYQAFDPSGKVLKQSNESGADTRHVRNFLDAMRSRKRQSLNQEIESGHISSVLCHAGNTAWRTGKTLVLDPKTEMYDDDEANGFVKREYRKGYELPEI